MAERTAGPLAVTRADVADLVDAFAGYAEEVFGPDAAPEDVNAFLHAIGLRVRIDGVARMADAEVSLSPQSTNPLPLN